tara:strand:+ start:1072 stop:1881 length:810 start_codon:yes stop_codon:yes gene_type:complete
MLCEEKAAPSELVAAILADLDLLPVVLTPTHVPIAPVARLAQMCTQVYQATMTAQLDVMWYDVMWCAVMKPRYPALTALSADWRITMLNLADTKVEDLSPLAFLVSLEELDLSGTGVTNVSPLAFLDSLKVLRLWYCKRVKDLSPLAHLVSLENLDLSFTKVKDLSPLASLGSLKKLDLSFTKVKDLSPMASLVSLEELDLCDTRVTNVSPLACLVSLKWLNLEVTRVEDVSPLASLLTRIHQDSTTNYRCNDCHVGARPSSWQTVSLE